jgi:hypothetical protein
MATAHQTNLERAIRPPPPLSPAIRPEMNRQERVIFTTYVVLAILVVLFLAASGVLWWHAA